MCKVEEAERGQKIAENIRKILLNCDLRTVYAEGEMKLAQQDFKLYSKAGGKANARKALRAKARACSYAVYVKNVTKIKAEVAIGLDAVLSHYTPKYKLIWKMYFIEQASINEICNATCYSRGNTNIIIRKLKKDLDYYYKGAERL